MIRTWPVAYPLLMTLLWSWAAARRRANTPARFVAARTPRRLTAPVQFTELEALDRVNAIAVVAPQLDDRDLAVAGEAIDVAHRHLPALAELLGRKKVRCRDAGHRSAS